MFDTDYDTAKVIVHFGAKWHVNDIEFSSPWIWYTFAFSHVSYILLV